MAEPSEITTTTSVSDCGGAFRCALFAAWTSVRGPVRIGCHTVVCQPAQLMPQGRSLARFLASFWLVVIGALSGCGDGNNYEAAEGSLRAWLSAVHEGDAGACNLVTDEYRQKFATAHDDCRQLVQARSSSAVAGLPPADGQMAVAVWDPLGEALVEVTDRGQVSGFWMQYKDGRWLVAGRAE